MALQPGRRLCSGREGTFGNHCIVDHSHLACVGSLGAMGKELGEGPLQAIGTRPLHRAIEALRERVDP
jgi:hypothetical protein